MNDDHPTPTSESSESTVAISRQRLVELLALAAENIALRAALAELQKQVPFLRDEIKHERDLRGLTGASPAMKAVRQAIQQVARTDSTVLILGETETGKELVARAIHQVGPRREQPFIAINCAALNPSVLTSELFGHEVGAFTGASKRRIGRFELAQRGTIFLDEVAEIAHDLQVLLLRVLQERVIERVGGNESIPVDVRVIAATHRDLERAVNDGRFRADLFFRLNVFPIRVPPLRERREDIPDLIQHFLHAFNRRMNRQVRQVEPETLRLLLGYAWPGNVRELENLVERAMIVHADDPLRMDPSWLLADRRPAEAPPAGSLRETERQSILSARERSGGKIYGAAGAAAILGLKPTTLYGKIRKHGITKDPRNDEQ